jgi:hypothetical protein
MNNCVYCSAILSAKGVFCPQCAKQSKCKNCSELLEINTKACAVCGTLIGEGNSTSVSQLNQNHFDNIFELTETSEFEGRKSSRNMRLGCSNEAVSNFGEFVERRIRGAQAIGSNETATNNYPNGKTALPPAESFEDFEENHDAIEIPQTKNPDINHSSEKEILHQVFRKYENRWKLDEIELNAKNKIDYARRITFLFLYFNDLEGRSKTPRSELNSILEDSTVYDGNFRDWISSERAIDKNDDDTLTLNAGGRRKAKECIKNLSENTVTNPWLPGATPKSSSKTSSSENEIKDVTKKRTGKKNPKTSVIFEKWKSLNLDVDGHKLFSTKSALDKGLLGLWAIRKAMGDDVKVVSSTQLHNFLFKAFEIKVHSRSLENALISDEAKTKATKISGTSFQILPPGVDYIEQIAGI